ncbi:BQ2448_2834 [Microbotryum intermedium]|uniref:BQ2448_2834 protein n=1 Tax=Microbotryum intermedium TaxID=269621 RepID=A0A238FJI9_9BASI|nr:BQ2448_2834 [Microbotryum intermedium]
MPGDALCVVPVQVAAGSLYSTPPLSGLSLNQPIDAAALAQQLSLLAANLDLPSSLLNRDDYSSASFDAPPPPLQQEFDCTTLNPDKGQHKPFGPGSTTTVSPPSEHQVEHLKATWNACTAKLASLLEPGSRLENLTWRRWNMERLASNDNGTGNGNSTDKNNSFYGTAEQQTNRSTYPMPPPGLNQRFDFVKAQEESLALDSLLGLSSAPPLRATPSTSAPPPPSMPQPQQQQQNFHQHRSLPLHAPQPHNAFQPMGWAAQSLEPPPAPSRIALATPSWTALFPSSAPPPVSNAFSPGSFSPSAPSQTQLTAPPLSNSLSGPSSGTASPYPFQPQSAGLFTLPPATTMYDDVNTALASSSGGPPAFYSSYGLYQPISGPYARFLTPSPEPSVLGDFELDLELASGGSGSGVDPGKSGDGGDGSNSIWNGTTPGSASNGTGLSPVGALATGGDLFEQMASISASSRPGMPTRGDSYESSTLHDAPPRPPTLALFSGLSTLAGAATSSAALGSLGNPSADGEDPFQELQQHMQDYSFPVDDATAASMSAWPATIEEDEIESALPSASGSSPKLGPQLGLIKSGKPRKPRKPRAPKVKGVDAPDASTLAAASASTSTRPSPEQASTSASTSAAVPMPPPQTQVAYPGVAGNSLETSPEDLGSTALSDAGPSRTIGKKNRNPHSTQLPTNGVRKIVKPEAEEGHAGPICTHCSSIVTPLWRRGPDDELLCNACGLYQKLHGKSRPRAFAKQPTNSKRSSNSAAAQAAASRTPPSCFNCAATSTPMWRKDQGGNLCCNACSLYYKLHSVVRPPSLAHKRKSTADGHPAGSKTNPSTRRNSIDQFHPMSPQTSPNGSPRINSGHALPSLAAAAAAAAVAAAAPPNANSSQANQSWEFDVPAVAPPMTQSPHFANPNLPTLGNDEGAMEMGVDFSLPMARYSVLSWRAITPDEGYSNPGSRAPSPEPRKRQRYDGVAGDDRAQQQVDG